MTRLDVRGVVLGVSTFGSAADPAVLLVMGVSASMDWWEPEFCASLAAAGRYVIRYDHRDTGESVSYPPGRPGYVADDLFLDPLGVLDALDVARAHLVGLSMGGALAQLAALHAPDRVRTLTLLSTSGGAGDPDLPPMGDFEPIQEPDWTDRAAVVDYQVAAQRQLASPTRPFDEAPIREIAGREFDRTSSPASAVGNHHAAEGGKPWRAELVRLTMPTLVLHGTEDPLFPLGHGEALASEIPNARLVVLPHTGHEFPRENWPVVLRELVAHTAR
ncbi:MAG TPA: alpha/beta hydrolase [Actinophytocola sp.]|nr:alpha/beta hydrolase [Actinophytocola sp.]